MQLGLLTIHFESYPFNGRLRLSPPRLIALTQTIKKMRVFTGASKEISFTKKAIAINPNPHLPTADQGKGQYLLLDQASIVANPKKKSPGNP